MTGYFTTIPPLPLNNIAPFTERDGTTYQQILREMRLAVIRIADAQVDLDAKMDVRLIQLNALLDTLDDMVDNALTAIREVGDQYLPEMVLVYTNLRNLADELEPLVETSRRLDQEIIDRESAVAGERQERMTGDNTLRSEANELRDFVELTMTKLPFSLYDTFAEGVAASASTGKPLVLPRGVQIDVPGPVVIPSNVKIEGNGATLHFPALVNQWVMEVASSRNVHLQDLHIRINNNGSPDQRGVRIISSGNVSLKNVTIFAVQPSSGPGDGGSQNGLQVVDCDGIDIDTVKVTNFDYTIWFNRVNDLTVNRTSAINYKTGFWIRDTRNAQFSWCLAEGKAPNSDALPGHNGFILDARSHGATEDVTFTDCVSNDAGEHGWRIGGAFRVSRVHHVRCVARNTGRSGFKCLGGTQENGSYHTEIYYTDCKVIDAADSTPNRGGFMVEMTKNAVISNPTVMRSNRTYSVGEGIVLSGVTNVRILNPLILDTHVHGIHLRPDFGNSTEVEIQGGFIHTYGIAVNINYTGITLRRIKFTAHPELGNNADNYIFAVRNDGGTGQIVGVNLFTMYAPNSPASYLFWHGGTYVRWMMDIKAEWIDSGYPTIGSTWQDLSMPQTRGFGRQTSTGWVFN